jgi:Rrf2 family protein
MYSQTVEYALRAAASLGIQWPTPATTKQIAKTTGVPPAYLSKVLQALARAGVVRSRRGVGGGISLVKGPRELSLLDVVNAVEPMHRIEACPLGLPAHAEGLCTLHKRLDDAFALIEETFRTTTLHEILEESTERKPLDKSESRTPKLETTPKSRIPMNDAKRNQPKRS